MLSSEHCNFTSQSPYTHRILMLDNIVIYGVYTEG